MVSRMMLPICLDLEENPNTTPEVQSAVSSGDLVPTVQSELIRTLLRLSVTIPTCMFRHTLIMILRNQAASPCLT